MLKTERLDMINKLQQTRLGAWPHAGHCRALKQTAALLLGLVTLPLLQAQTFTTLYSFTGGSDGGEPVAGVIQDPAGNLYGTTYLGGTTNCVYGDGCGTVFKIDTAGNETVLHSFTGPDGAYPYTPLTRDKAGNIYGTTYYGGSVGLGAVFKLDTAGNETVLYSFTGGPDGCEPDQGLVIDKSGSVFGTTIGLDCRNNGTIFKVDSAGKFTILHGFAGAPTDGASPSYGHLIMDKYGSLYGVTTGGGSSGCNQPYGCGVLYELNRDGTFTVLHSFAGGTSDGCFPFGSVAMDEAGNLYGTTFGCGSGNVGTIWKVSKKGSETILHNFSVSDPGGCNPFAGVATGGLESANVYGVTAGCDYSLWKLTSAETKLAQLYSFDLTGGGPPMGEAWQNAKGTLYGTTSYGSTYNYGTVWKYVP
jgi:uncharacterized repeat protein (TIGR03803 family)